MFPTSSAVPAELLQYAWLAEDAGFAAGGYSDSGEVLNEQIKGERWANKPARISDRRGVCIDH